MKKLYLLSIIVLFGFNLKAQLFEISSTPVFRDENGSVLSLALAGGLNQPQFSPYDFDQDGKMDLFVFDRTGNKVLVFIAVTVKGVTNYRYDPSYEDFFPKGEQFMQLHDFDADGKPDLWMYLVDSVMLYKNVSTTLPQFEAGKGLFALDKVNYVSWSPNKKLSQVNGCLPAIYDVDGDSDMDFITNLNSIGSKIVFNCNNSIELGNSLSEIGFTIVDKCYGGVDEFGADIIINATCDYYEAYYKQKKHTASKTLLFFDNDGDGDNDMFFGSSERSTNPIYFLENGKKDLNYYKDTFISIDTSFFSIADEAKIPIAPAMFYLDINFDGIKDLILANNEQDRRSYAIHETDNVLLFLNSGADDTPIFNLDRTDFLVGDMIDLGGRVAPIFADIDGDGDQDLILATSGNHAVTGDTTDFLVYYQNVGTSTSPDFKEISTDFIALKAKKYRGMVPAFGDLDGDADLDLLLGKQDGTIAHYENTGSSTNPSFTLKTETFSSITVDGNAAPALVDMNNDGKLDMLLGNYGGTVVYYTNTGTLNAPEFKWVTDSLGGIVVNELISQKFLGDTGFYDSLIYYYYGNSAPQIIHYEKGVRCLAVGCDEGNIKIYDIPSDLTQDFEAITDYMKRSYTNEVYTKDWGKNTYPSVADITGDGISDMIIGNSRGGIHFVQGKEKRTNRIAAPDPIRFRIVPNPTNDKFAVYAPSNAPLFYTLSNLSGQVLASGSTLSGVAISHGLALPNGIYFVSLKTTSQQFTAQKLIITNE
jgi:hypothetical protein